MKTYLLIIIGLIMLLGSCKKDTPSTPTPVKEIYLSADQVILKDYFYFNKGTYWIYKDSISQATDTVTVLFSKIGLVDVTPQYADTIIKYENVSYLMSHSQTSNSSIFSFNAVQSSVSYTSELPTSMACVATPINSGYVKQPTGELTQMTGEKAVSVGAFNFKKGIEMPWIHALDISSYPRKPSYEYTNFKITYARDIGIIRREIKNDTLHQVWELVDYKIVR